MPIKGTFTGTFSFGALKKELVQGDPITASGGSISTWNGYTIHIFTSNGTFSVSDAPADSEIEYFVVGGGGPGGNGLSGGGGGGAVNSGRIAAQAGNYSINVAAQSGESPSQGTYGGGSGSGRGYDSWIDMPNGIQLRADGGGQGGWWQGYPGLPGGCGGGGGNQSSPQSGYNPGGNTRQPGFGNPGGRGQRYPDDNSDNNHRGGGGGGAGSVGHWSCGSDSHRNGANQGGATGGMGYYSTFDGTARYWAGGGGGANWNGNVKPGNGGLGGGGGGNHAANGSWNGQGGGSAWGTGESGQGGSGGGHAAAHTGGGGGGSYGQSWGASSRGRGGSGMVMVRYRTAGIEPTYGLTEATAASSAWAIKSAWPNAPTGTYWLQSGGGPYKCHCIMDLEGGGWELAVRTDGIDIQGDQGTNSNQSMMGGWAGWIYTSKSQCDSFNTYYERAGDSKTISPSAVYRYFKDVMVIANNDRSKRMGHRWNSTQPPITTILNTSGTNKASTNLFGGYNFLSLGVRQETNNSYGGGSFFGFNIYSDTGSGGAALAGGQPDNTQGWAKAQIGVGRDNTTSGYFGGGIGATAQSRYFQIGGHWWGHGSGKDSWYWSNNEYSEGFYGHSVYVRNN